MKNDNKFNYNLIEKKLKNFVPLKLNRNELKRSAVLFLIKPTPSSYNVIFTSRSPKLKHHTGEISFPGGRFDSKIDKSLKETALRETYEEIGLHKDNIKIIGRLDDLPTLTGFLIRVFVGLISKSNKIQFQLNYKEVIDLIEIPIDFIAKKDLFYTIPFPKDPKNWEMLCFKYIDPVSNKNFKIWGATAHMLQEFLKKIYGIKVIIPEYQRPKISDCIEFLHMHKK